MARAARRPLIGVTGPRRRAWGPRACVHVALVLAGARPVHLRPGSTLDVARLDGLVVTGGHDVEPVLYQAAAEVRGHYDPERDAFELDALRQADDLRRPLLAICRGAQLLNVCFGGSLVQDLKPRRRRTSDRRSLLPLKPVSIVAGTRLEAAVGAAPLRVNSLHRQAVDRVGEGLRVSGRDADDIVQAVEHDGRDFVLGVQWHPELLVYLARQRRLFGDLVRAADRAAERAEELS